MQEMKFNLYYNIAKTSSYFKHGQRKLNLSISVLYTVLNYDLLKKYM